MLLKRMIGMKKYGFVLCAAFIICLLTGCAADERGERAQRAASALLTCPTEEMAAYMNGESDESPKDFIRRRFQAADFTEDGLEEAVSMSMTSWLLDGMCVEEDAAVRPESMQVQIEDETLCVVTADVNVQTQAEECTVEVRLRVQFDSESGKIRYISFDDTALAALYAKIKG